MSAPTLIFFYSWKWTSGLIIFWINRAASLSTTILSLILFLVSSCLSLTHMYTMDCIYRRIYQKLANVHDLSLFIR